MQGHQQRLPLPQLSECRVIGRLLELAREIRKPCQYIGYSAFLCFALQRRCRPHVWEGGKRINLITTFATWASLYCTNDCVVDAVYCCSDPAVAGGMVPVSETHPLNLCHHYVAATQMEHALDGNPASIEGFYMQLGVALLGTVVDGDCGIDVLCQMAGLPQTLLQRIVVREETQQQ